MVPNTNIRWSLQFVHPTITYVMAVIIETYCNIIIDFMIELENGFGGHRSNYRKPASIL